VKSEWFDRHLRLNIAAYYTIDKGIQRSTLYTDAEGDTASTISNAGRADFYGGELEASVILPEGIRIDGTAAYTHPKYVQYADVASGFDRSNEPFYIVPAWTASISPSWSHRFQVGTFTLRGDFAYQSDMPLFPQGFYTDAAGTIRDASTGVAVSAADAEGFTKANTDVAHWLVNARADLVVMDGKLDVAVWGKNLTNQRDLVAGDPLFGLGDATAIRREPRTYGVTATIKFGG
jgi:iron complex outermembrane receptor protein